MSKSRLVCNLGMDDFFTLPDSSEVWRKKGGEPLTVVDGNGKHPKKFYECESLYDPEQKTVLPGNQRVDLADV